MPTRRLTPHPRVVLTALAASIAAVIVALVVFTPHTPTPTPGPTPGATGTPTPTPTGSDSPTPSGSPTVGPAKPPLTGLTVLGKVKPQYPISNKTILVTWAEIEPNPGDYQFGTITDQLAALAAAGLHAKLRVMAGLYAPDWAKTLSGGTFTYINGAGRPVPGMPRWWAPAYGDAYHDLMVALSAQFDADPTLREVALSRCMTLFAEPLWREFRRQPNLAGNAVAAGYTDTADKACQAAMVTEDAAAWPTTNVDLAITGAPYVNSLNVPYVDGQIAGVLIGLLRATVGDRGVIENNELIDGAAQTAIYKQIVAAGPPYTLQVQTYARLHPPGVPGVLAALHVGCEVLAASSVELPGGYVNATPEQIAPYAAACGGPADTASPSPSPPAGP